MKIYTQKKTEKGFTLVETLVAITILLLVIIGPLTVAQKGIQNAYYANEQVTAVFLAQEAIEAVRELRDTNALEEYEGWTLSSPGVRETWDWYTDTSRFASDCKVSGVGCGFKNSGTDKFKSCSSSSINNCILKVNNGVYSHTGGGSDSPFTRKVYVGAIAGGGVSVTVEVTWQSQIFGGTTTRTVKLQTWIYDHYQRYEEN